MKPWIVVALVGAGSFGFRVSMLVFAARRGLPRVVELAARHAVPVSFAALASSFLTDRVTHLTIPLVPVAAALAAAVAVRRTRSPRTALLVGMPVVWMLSTVLNA